MRLSRVPAWHELANADAATLSSCGPAACAPVVFAGKDPLTGRLRYIRETCKTVGEAEAALTKLLRQVDQQRHPKSAITVREAVQQWLEVAELEVTTRERYEDLIRLYIAPRLGDLQAARLDAELLEGLYARLHLCRDLCSGKPPKGHTCRPLSSSTTRKIHYILRDALDRSVRWRFLSVKPRGARGCPLASADQARSAVSNGSGRPD
jgi:integrase